MRCQCAAALGEMVGGRSLDIAKVNYCAVLLCCLIVLLRVQS